MSSPAGVPSSFGQWPTPQPPGTPMLAHNDCEEEGVELRPMRLKVLYTFDDQNKTNCLARWPNVLQIQTVAMDETTTIGVIELKTCIQAIVQCSPELVARMGQDYTVYAYDYSEYDNPLVGQGMLSWALAAASPTPGAPASQSRQLITGRVCKNIPGIFSNGIKETLEVKLRLVRVPTVLQSEYVSTMEKYREISKVMPPGLDMNEWNAFLQSNPNVALLANKISAPSQPTSNQRDGVSMEVINQLLSPSLQPQSVMDPMNQPQNTENSRSDSPAGIQLRNTSRPSSRGSVRGPYKKRQKADVGNGGNTSGYEEGTDGDDRPAPRKRNRGKKNANPDENGTDVESKALSKKRTKKSSNGDDEPERAEGDDSAGRKKRAKITKADWTSKDTIGSASDSLRVTASTAASIRLFRPIAMSAGTAMGSHLQELPRAPTPVPNLPAQNLSHGTASSQSNLRRGSNLSENEQWSYPSPDDGVQPSLGNDDQLLYSIESANPSPERNGSRFDTPPDIGSSPPVMRTASPLQSSPPCPSSPELPQMPRTDSGFMSGSLEDLFGEDDDTMHPIEVGDDESMRPIEIEDVEVVKRTKKRRGPISMIHHGFPFQEETPGPMDRLPTKMPQRGVPLAPKPAPAPQPRAESVASENGPTVPALQQRPMVLARSQSFHGQVRSHAAEEPVANGVQHRTLQPMPASGVPVQPSPAGVPVPASNSGSASRSLIRTASMGSLTLPTTNTVTANDPVVQHSNFQRSQTWSQTPHPFSELPTDDEEMTGKNNTTRKRLQLAVKNGEMPPFCFNCGAIETPTWRKVFTKDVEGVPGYYDYSDKPGRITAIDILERDSGGQPKSFRIIKKNIGKEDNKNEFKLMTLCNPCGIWIQKYKQQRPEDKFNKPLRRRKGRSNGINQFTSEANYQHSEAPFTQSESNNQTQVDVVSESITSLGIRRASSVRPQKRLKAMTSDAASAALRRAIQSSPARWAGSQQSPIDVEEEDLGDTRRLLFPSPRKDDSPKVLGEVITTNVVSVATAFHSPKEASTDTAVADKENCPPALGEEDVDEELLRLFEEEMARPTTPVQKTPPQNPFKTPTRPTPSHRPITRSVTRSNNSTRTIKSPGAIMVIQKTPTRTPGSVRRSPRNHAGFESPFTATLNQLMSDANNNAFSPSRQYNTELDFGNLPPLDGSHSNPMSFDHLPAFDSDFFSTDVPMPSSPPRMFNLYEDSHALGNMDNMWNLNFSSHNSHHGLGMARTISRNGDEDEMVLVKTEPGSGEKSLDDLVDSEASKENEA